MTKDLREQIASRLRSVRKAVGFSQGDVAKRLQVHRPTISEIEAGRRRVSADELTQLAQIYGVPVEWFTSGSHAEAGLGDECLTLLIKLVKALKYEDLDRVIAWLSRMQKPKAGWEDEEEPYTPARPAEEERAAAENPPQRALEAWYMQCLHYDIQVGDWRAREDSRCRTLIPVRGDEQAMRYCSQHQSDAPGAPATPEDLDEVCAVLKTRPADAPLLKLITTVREAQAMKADAGNSNKQLLTA